MSIVTKKGDKGETGIFDGRRLPKNSGRIEAIGSVDELNSAIGILLCQSTGADIALEPRTTVLPPHPQGHNLSEQKHVPPRDYASVSLVRGELKKIQEHCFTIGAELATPADSSAEHLAYIPRIKEADLRFLEDKISQREPDLPKQNKFILPGGTEAAALSFWARAIARRAERAAVDLDKAEAVNPIILQYLNRLSDYFFILGRFLNRQAGQAETEWQGGGPR